MHQTRTIAIEFSLSAASARRIGNARYSERYRNAQSEAGRVNAGAELLSLSQVSDGDIKPFRFRVVVAAHLFSVTAAYEERNELGEQVWLKLDSNHSLEFANVAISYETIIGMALQRLGAIAYEKAKCTILNDGKAIKYDLGVV